MYNEELKARFVREKVRSLNTAKVCEQTFEAIAPYEKSWNADICTRSTEELSPVVETLIGLRVRSKWTRLIILKDYVRWCIAIGVPNACDGMLSVEPSGLDKIRTMTVSSPTHLQKYLNEICDKESENTIDCIYRCYYWLAFAGLKEADIYKIKCSDVDFNYMCVKFNGNEYEIYREAIPAFRNAALRSTFIYKHPLYAPVERDRIPGDLLIRGIRSKATSHAMITELSRRSAKNYEAGNTSLRLSYHRVWLSGLFYRMYERERAGFPVDFSAAAAEFAYGKDYKLDSCRNSIESKLKQIERDYVMDYERWKAANQI